MLAGIAYTGGHMPKFVIEREIPGAGNLTDAELREISRKSLAVLRGMGPNIQWLQSYVLRRFRGTTAYHPAEVTAE